MGDSAKLRLVRCPKCENLLPELPGYSVYQCGGCGAVLRAKQCDNEGGRKVSERATSEAREEGVVSEESQVVSAKSASGGVENGDSDISNGPVVADTLPNESKGPSKKPNTGKTDLGDGVLESSTDQIGQFDQSSSHVERPIGLPKHKGLERGADQEGGFGFRSFKYAGEGTSRYNGNGVDRDKPSREELLRKLDELKEQLSKACDGDEKQKEKGPVEGRVFGPETYAAPDHWYPDHSAGLRRGSRQLYDGDESGIRANYHDRYHEPYGPMRRSRTSLNDYHSSVQDLSHVPGYDNSYGSRLYSRPLPRQTSCLSSQQPRSHPHMPGHYLGAESDMFEPIPYNNPSLNQFPCSCYQCYHKHSQLPVQIPSTAAYRRHPMVSSKPVQCHHEKHGSFVPQGCDSRISHPHMGSYDPHPQTRWPGDHNVARPRRVVLANDGRRCRPMAGGAPFVTCHNCFELLELPKKAPKFDKNRWKIRCGGCSSLISFAMVDEKLIPVDAPPKQTLKDAFDSSDEVLLDRPYDPHGGMRRDNMGFHSEDYDNSGYDFQSVGKELNSSSDRHAVNSSKSEELRSTHLLSPSASEDEVCAASFSTDPNEMPGKADLSPPPPGSPLQDHLDHSTKFRAVNRCGKGNLSSRSDQERVLPCKNPVRQNSLKESLATELDLSLNDFANTGIPHDAADTSGEEDLPKAKKGVDSFLAGIIKKSFRDFSKSSQTAENGKRSVFVNGRLIPDRSVKKAEKMAGPITPGHYWYDFKAGFWGVMGGPGLGIIPPNIEEFNYPLPQKCAGGNTGIIVNGRELHQNDLELLASRGLPATSNRSYFIDICGKVVDEDTGEELDCLGKLAPTIEKVKHGFGMRAPKTAVS